jgi:uncharacterized protein YegP (UPF0339 family)
MSKRPYRFIVFRTSDAGWTWHLKAPNGRIICTPHDRYATQSHAKRSARDVMLALQVRDVVCP